METYYQELLNKNLPDYSNINIVENQFEDVKIRTKTALKKKKQ